MAIDPVPAFPFPRRPFSSITPFTYSDAMTHLELLEKLRVYAGVTLPDEINKVLDDYSVEITAEVQAAIDMMIGTINDKIIEIDDALADQQADYTQKISDLTVYVDDAVQQIINNAIEVQDPVVAGIVGDEDSSTRAALAAWVTDITSLVPVEKYPRLVGEETDDRRIGLALAEAIQRNTGVFFAGKTYEIENEIVLTQSISGFVFQGVRGATILRKPEQLTGNINAIGLRPDPGETIENVKISGFHFDGALQNESEFIDVRMRSTSGVTGNFDLPGGVNPGVEWPSSRLNSGIRAYGNNRRTSSAFGVTRNVYVSECSFYGTVGLPVYFNGVYGDAVVKDSHFRRCLDTGYIFTDNCVFEGNTVEFSMDNGVSMSRGSLFVKCLGNTITESWYNGIWAGGFEGDAQTAEVIISANNVDRSGQHGIYLGLSGSDEIVISSNTIKRTYARWGGGNGSGTSSGIRIDNHSVNIFPRAVNITGNIIYGTDRGGILLTRCAWVAITGNTMTAIARNQFPDGPIEDTQGTALAGITHAGDLEVSFRSIISNNVIIKSGDTSQYGVFVRSPSETQHVMANNVTRGFTVSEGRAS